MNSNIIQSFIATWHEHGMNSDAKKNMFVLLMGIICMNDMAWKRLYESIHDSLPGINCLQSGPTRYYRE